MKKGLVFTMVLALILVGVMLFSAMLIQNHNQRQAEYERQVQLLKEQEQKLADKEAELNVLVLRYEQGLTEGTAELERLRAELAALKTVRDKLQTQLEQSAADIETTREKLKNEESDQSYYLEVYNALTEGLNKVKGYIGAG